MASNEVHRPFWPWAIIVICLTAILLVLLFADEESSPGSAHSIDERGATDLAPEAVFEIVADAVSWRRMPLEAARFEQRLQEDPDDQQALEVIVLANEAPVSDAEVVAFDKRGLVSILRTDSTGKCQVLCLADAALSIRVEKDGFAAVDRDLLAPVPNSAEVRLSPAGSISGVVRLADRTRIESGTYVIAWPSDRPPLRTQRLVLRRGAAILSMAEVERDGSFTLEGLDLNTRYSISAAGPGSVAGVTVNGVWAGTVDVELELWHLYGHALVVSSDDQSPLRFSEELRQPRLGSTVRHFEAEPASVDTVEAVVAGVDPRQFGVLHGSHVFLFKHPDLLRMLGPLEIDLDLPGYEPLKANLFLSPLAKGMATSELMLLPDSACWGTLELVLQGLPAIDRDPESLNIPHGYITLTSGSGEQFEISIREETQLLIQDVPCGTYAIEFRAYQSGTGVRPTDPGSGFITISESAKSTAQFELSGLGALELIIIDQNRDPWAGGATVYLTHTSGSQAMRTSMRGPIRLLCLDPGSYSLVVHPLPFGDYPPIQLDEVTVTAGTLSSARAILQVEY